MRRLTSFIVLLAASGVVLASAKLDIPWKVVHIESKLLVIDARMTSDYHYIEEFRVAAAGRSSSVPTHELKRFRKAELSTIDIEWDCSKATSSVDSEYIDQCEKLVSMRYWEDTDACNTDNQYCPRVEFVFSKGKFLESRLIHLLPPGA